ncbi:Hypothetical predicted protein [Cloeon dipterum]|uniref:Nephrin n=2 Tax=Cloeon dipterum TaxID=197152 RepID=A0A8S1CCB4_9INSE|nr:Hypothetical predicted protein [Cloeon dipterum]
MTGAKCEISSKMLLAGTLLLALAATASAVKEVPITNMVAIAGEATYMPCDITTPEPMDAVVLVLWYREDLGTPIYSVDGRDKNFSQAERWSAENVFGSRAYFISDRNPAELGIDSVKVTDAGTYRCRVDFKVAQTRNSKVNLTIIVPPQRIVITDEVGTERVSVVGPYVEGSKLILRCDVFGGQPVPKVRWLRNDVVVQSSSPRRKKQSPGGVVSAEILIDQLDRKDVHSELTCQAINNNKTAPLSASVHVDMNFRPLNVLILGANQPLSAGRRYDLLCQSSGSRPPATITWWRNGQRLTKSKETTSNDGNTTTSTLSFTPSKEDEGHYLSCRAENPHLSADALEDGWKLEILYIPEATIHLGTSLSPDNIREGTDVYFDCRVNARPAAYKVEWRHNGKPLNHNTAAGVIVSNQSLVLQKVGRNSAGNYSCVGFNTEGDGESDAFFLDVLYAPTCRPSQPRVHGVAKQERARIQCNVDANPVDLKFRWTFNNSADSVDVASAQMTHSGTQSWLTYTPMTELDYGSLLCWASNKVGSQRLPCVFHIIAAGRPDQVHNCSVLNSSTHSFSVSCTEGFNGGLPQSFLLEVRETATQELAANATAPNSPKFMLGGLKPGTSYRAFVFSVNAKGKSEPVVLHANTLRLPEKQLTTSESDRPRSGLKLTPTMSVLVGVAAALLVVALVACAVLRSQCPSRDRPKNRANQQGGVDGGSCSIGLGLLEKTGSSTPTTLKLEPLAAMGAVSDCSPPDGADEKDPDIIPQPCIDPDEVAFMRHRQLVSTIDTTPPHGRSSHIPPPGQFAGYCTLRNGGLGLRDLNTMVEMQPTGYSQCTLPRPHHSPWGGPPGPSVQLGPPMVQYGSRYAPPPVVPPSAKAELTPVPSQFEDDLSEAPLVTKRESTV